MLTRFTAAAIRHSQALTIVSSRLLNTSAVRYGDGDHTDSKAKDKAAQDLKSGKEKRWLDTVASDSGKSDTCSPKSRDILVSF